LDVRLVFQDWFGCLVGFSGLVLVFQGNSWILSVGFSGLVWMFGFGFSGIAWILNRLG